MEEIENYLKKYYTKKTIEAYLREIEIYISNNTSAKNYTYAQIVNYIGVLRQRYSNSRTINRIVSSIKVYYDFLCFTGKRNDNPTKSIYLKDKQSRDVQLQDLFSTEELESLLTAKAERFNNLDYRNKVLMSLLIYQALKPYEMQLLQIDDVNLEEGTIYVKQSAKTNSRTLPLRANQILLFKIYMDEIRLKLLQDNNYKALLIGQRATPMLAEDITKHIKRSYGKLFYPRNVNAQTIRQSVISNLLKENKDLRIVQTFAGHKYPSTTERYKQNNVTQLKLALEFYHPFK